MVSSFFLTNTSPFVSKRAVVSSFYLLKYIYLFIMALEDVEACIKVSTTTENESVNATAVTEVKRLSNKSIKKKEDLWKTAKKIVLKKLDPPVTIEWDKNTPHVIYARVVSGSTSISAVLEAVIDEQHMELAREILENRHHIEFDSHPSARTLLELGAVWLLNEELYLSGQGAHAHRVKDASVEPDWHIMTLRIHHTPERHYAVHAYEWDKPCKSLLLGQAHVKVNGKTVVTDLSHGLPNVKDGVVLYSCDRFAILNKPGNVPVHPSLSNHSENLVEQYSRAIHKHTTASNNAQQQHYRVSVPHHHPGIDTEAYGLVLVAKQSNFSNHLGELAKSNKISKTYKCLVTVRDADRMGLLEAFAKTGNPVIHYYDPHSHHFVRHNQKPAEGKKQPQSSGSNHQNHHLQKCELQILSVGDDKFRAACVQTQFADSPDACLAHRLWGNKIPPEVKYVMEITLRVIARPQSHQIPGQLAALGFPIVGDFHHGGGRCELFYEHHAWKHMALQVASLEFSTEKEEEHWECALSKCWWSDYLAEYELVHMTVGLNLLSPSS
jgi:23S rRNA-/tRNA-specific pseudouridylate synthase